MEPITPLQSKQEVRLKLAAPADGRDVTIYLAATDAGDGSAGDSVIWQRPRLVAPGQPELLLRDVRGLAGELAARRERTLGRTADYLAAASEVEAGRTDISELARQRGQGV